MEKNEHLCEIGQATSMARFAGIELRPQQINDYIFARNCEDKEFMGESDQVLLDLCLDHTQEIQFRKTFNNIFKS
jgi:hypothetical protein